MNIRAGKTALSHGSGEEFIAQDGLRKQQGWFKELLFGGASCAAGGFAAHLASCIVMPILATGALSSSNIYIDRGNLAIGMLYHFPDTWVTKAVAGCQIADTLFKSALTSGLCYGIYKWRYHRRLKMRPRSIRRFNARFFILGAAISAAFNFGSFVENKEAYARQNNGDYTRVVALPYGVKDNFLAWQAYKGSSCLAPRRPNEPWNTYVEETAVRVGTAIKDGVTSPFNGRLKRALAL